MRTRNREEREGSCEECKTINMDLFLLRVLLLAFAFAFDLPAIAGGNRVFDSSCDNLCAVVACDR
jgi:hypothetical protein